ncbi:MAG: hypothetical protein MRZ79_23980 [Bacteroidia bacterium]|nr:hypothetical protein [Bacteroidia bacterium]
MHRTSFRYRRLHSSLRISIYAGFLALLFGMTYFQNLQRLATKFSIEVVEEYEGEGKEGKKENKNALDEVDFLSTEPRSQFTSMEIAKSFNALMAYWESHIPEKSTPPPELI